MRYDALSHFARMGPLRGSELFSVRGKTAVVTGGSRGILVLLVLPFAIVRGDPRCRLRGDVWPDDRTAVGSAPSGSWRVHRPRCSASARESTIDVYD